MLLLSHTPFLNWSLFLYLLAPIIPTTNFYSSLKAQSKSHFCETIFLPVISRIHFFCLNGPYHCEHRCILTLHIEMQFIVSLTIPTTGLWGPVVSVRHSPRHKEVLIMFVQWGHKHGADGKQASEPFRVPQPMPGELLHNFLAWSLGIRGGNDGLRKCSKLYYLRINPRWQTLITSKHKAV